VAAIETLLLNSTNCNKLDVIKDKYLRGIVGSTQNASLRLIGAGIVPKL